MKRHQGKDSEISLKQAVAALRAEKPEAETIEAASEKVWQRLTESAASAGTAVDSIHGCHDVRLLLPQYRGGQLSPAKALLVNAHLHECVACRREAATGKRSPSSLQPWQHELPRAGNNHFRWALAATAVVIFAVGAYFLQDLFLARPTGMRGRVESLSGALYRVGFSGEQPLTVGNELMEGETIRTGSGSRAMLRLRDGSAVEMNERAEVAVSMRRNDTTIQLGRGNIIVQAAKRQTGHLYVAAQDCRVSVTGTVFSVNSGMRGSRVSVIEGEVRVAASGATSVLHSGDQLSTNASLSSVPVKEEIAWSQNLDKHLALLAEFAHLGNKLGTIPMPGLRYQSKLLPALPGTTVLYASIPNLGDAAKQANQLFQQELQESQVLNEWWQQAQARKGSYSFEEAIDEIHSLSEYLGDEIVFSFVLDGGRHGSPLLIAQIQRQGLKEFITGEISRHTDSGKPGLHVIDERELSTLPAEQDQKELLVLVRPDFVAASNNAGTLQRFNAALKQNSNGLASTPFGQRVAQAYSHGVSLLLAADLHVMEGRLSRSGSSVEDHAGFERTGFADAKYLVVERKDAGGQPLNQAELTFNNPRRGLASWLAAPAPIGGLDFVSKDAGAVAAFVTKSPAQMLDDVLSIAYASNPKAEDHIAKGESELKIKLHQDLADTLGGELTLALDGPILPTPSWKIVAEVYNPGRLQATIQQLLQDANEHSRKPGQHVTLNQDSVNGLTYYSLQFQDSTKNAEVDYTFVDGYLIVAPTRALVMTAIKIHQSGNSLAKSGDFHNLLPQDDHADVSAVIYQNLAPVVGPVMQQLSPSQLQSLQRLAAETKPSVVCAYGQESAVSIASNSRFFGLDLNTMALSTLLNLAHPRRSSRN